ncbi:thioredoxin-like [Callorhinchus milii]|uniref:thioredoxin-like n=1 Tax=Callorhinchus milii TaxID=7868 RepID=UPI001C3F86F2|nr:thioredoxin-like [Callorhinchus milii]
MGDEAKALGGGGTHGETKMALRPIKTKKQLDTLLGEEDENLIVVFFAAKWCGNCTSIKPFLRQRSQQHPNVVFVEVDVDESEELARGSGITCMPTFHFYKCQTKVGEFSGTKREKLDRLIMDLK